MTERTWRVERQQELREDADGLFIPAADLGDALCRRHRRPDGRADRSAAASWPRSSRTTSAGPSSASVWTDRRAARRTIDGPQQALAQQATGEHRLRLAVEAGKRADDDVLAAGHGIERRSGEGGEGQPTIGELRSSPGRRPRRWWRSSCGATVHLLAPMMGRRRRAAGRRWLDAGGGGPRRPPARRPPRPRARRAPHGRPTPRRRPPRPGSWRAPAGRSRAAVAGRARRRRAPAGRPGAA